jgi:uncharacterized protein YdeI (YjbR/CyaY-like superfamily)
MDITQTLYITDRKDWRNWLKQHYKTENEIWLVYPKKATGKPRIEYNDAVEQALCFGWIDSIIKTLDAEHTVQRFSPRKPKANTHKPTSSACVLWWQRRKSSKK